MSWVKELSREVEALRSEMVEALMRLIRVPAISPDYGGEGEYEKAERLLEIMEGWGFDRVERYDAPDPRAKGGVRPNIIAYYYGEDGDEGERLWILSHLDVVPPGDLGKWSVTRPFEPVVRDGRVYGRGSEDNGQGIVSSLYAARALMNLGLRPRRTIVLGFVSDEEAGSEYGLKWLLKNHPELFRRSDLILVPDGGSSDGLFIEVAEKSILWLRIRVKGRQVHASTPGKGLNAHRVAAELVLEVDRLLHEKYSGRDDLFDPPESTFEPTIARNTSSSPNIVPGEHELVFDCRILPGYSVDEVLSDIKTLSDKMKEKYRRSIDGEIVPEIDIEVLNRIDAPAPTPRDSKVVRLLQEALRIHRGREARVGGIGAFTVASAFRRQGIPAVVWATLDETAHQPDEYARVDNIVEDAKVMATLAML